MSFRHPRETEPLEMICNPQHTHEDHNSYNHSPCPQSLLGGLLATTIIMSTFKSRSFHPVLLRHDMLSRLRHFSSSDKLLPIISSSSFQRLLEPADAIFLWANRLFACGSRFLWMDWYVLVFSIIFIKLFAHSLILLCSLYFQLSISSALQICL